MPIPKDKKGLTVKQKKFVKAYVKNDGNGTKAILETYNTTSEDVARSMAAENLAKPTIRDEIDKALERHKITMDAAVKPIADGLKAYRSVVDADGNIHTNADHSIRLKASGMALKLMGAEQKEQPGSINFNFKGDATFNASEYKK